jgi:predicted Zn-dependent peptidase
VLPGVLAAQDPPDALPPALTFESFTLDNGLRVILSEDRATPTYSICVAYHVGSGSEDSTTAGFAHLIEHLMFEGSDNVAPGEHERLVSSEGGELRAETTTDAALFCEAFPSSQIALGLFLESDRMRSLDTSPVRLNAAGQFVAAERAERFETATYGLSYETLVETAYDDFANAHVTIPPLGAIARATPESVARFHAMYFAPNNAVLVLVGDFDAAEMRSQVTSYFGDIPRGPDVPPSPASPVLPSTAREATIGDPYANRPRLDIAYRTIPGNSPQWYMLAMAGEVLAGGESSRLYTRLVEQEGLALDVDGGLEERRGRSLFLISVIADVDADLDMIEQIINDEIARLRTVPADGGELERVRNRMERAAAMDRYSTTERAAGLALNAVLYSDPDLINRTSAIRAGITADLIRSAAEIYLTEGNRTVVRTLPEAGRRILGGPRP